MLDIGCGTGRFLAVLAREAKVWGIDASAEMLGVARTRVPPGVRLKQARAERPPFRTGWFERVVYWLVIHLLDRPAAFREAHRLLGEGGRCCIVTFDEAHFGGYWANRFFPRLEELDRAAFPTADELERELREVGFSSVRMLRRVHGQRIDRDVALAKIRGKHISTYDRLEPDEFELGLRRAEQELPAKVETRLRWLLAFAER